MVHIPARFGGGLSRRSDSSRRRGPAALRGPASCRLPNLPAHRGLACRLSERVGEDRVANSAGRKTIRHHCPARFHWRQALQEIDWEDVFIDGEQGRRGCGKKIIVMGSVSLAQNPDGYKRVLLATSGPLFVQIPGSNAPALPCMISVQGFVCRIWFPNPPRSTQWCFAVKPGHPTPSQHEKLMWSRRTLPKARSGQGSTFLEKKKLARRFGTKTQPTGRMLRPRCSRFREVFTQMICGHPSCSPAGVEALQAVLGQHGAA